MDLLNAQNVKKTNKMFTKKLLKSDFKTKKSKYLLSYKFSGCLLV